MPSVAILALPHCVHSSVVGTLDVLMTADSLWRDMGSRALFTPVDIVTTDGKPVTAHSGQAVAPSSSIGERPVPDMIIVPAIMNGLDAALENKRALRWIGNSHSKGSVICSVCAGAFLLAEAGLLTKRQATTHWALVDSFQTRYPDVDLKPERMLVDNGDTICAGGVTAYLDLALHLAGRFGSTELAATCSKLLLIDPQRDIQSPYRIFAGQKGHGDKQVETVQNWLEEHHTRPITVPAMAEVAGLGLRTFTRHFTKATGDSPSEYLQRLRMETAKRLLESTNHSVDEVAEACGYADSTAFRRRFKAVTGVPPGRYRARFSLLETRLGKAG
ncbi:transcriptional regulator, AraC family [Desulfovibrio ferrophilus]|uniref:Transcriptional regulator, AraC family n=2 Tax=Desulfovibrio ferrophilus TaxID=241368 RepID=A0A2Z6B2U9_9BACT|nr:transcriptional regulator, AraC family [Desulfovibrio ferrophilus]